MKPARDLKNWVADSLHDRSENPTLHDKVSKLRWKAVEGKAAEAENRELRALVSFDRSGAIPPGTQAATGEVIDRSLTDPYSAVNIDLGTGDGVAVGDPVINGEGLVGRVDRVWAKRARVELITAGRSAVSAAVVGTHSRGVVKPTPTESGQLQLTFIDSAVFLHKGEELVTLGWRSGRLGSHFPSGLPIGEIAGGSINEQEASAAKAVKPYANLSELVLVQVLAAPAP